MSEDVSTKCRGRRFQGHPRPERISLLLLVQAWLCVAPQQPVAKWILLVKGVRLLGRLGGTCFYGLDNAPWIAV